MSAPAGASDPGPDDIVQLAVRIPRKYRDHYRIRAVRERTSLNTLVVDVLVADIARTGIATAQEEPA